MELWLNSVDSPLGEMMLVTDEHCRVRALEFADHESRLFRGLREHYGDPHLYDGPGRFSVGAIAAKLKRYFDGDVAALDDIQVATGGSELQRQVWAALRRIPALRFGVRINSKLDAGLVFTRAHREHRTLLIGFHQPACL